MTVHTQHKLRRTLGYSLISAFLIMGISEISWGQSGASNGQKQDRLEQVTKEISDLERRRDAAAQRAEEAQDRARRLSKSLVETGAQLRSAEENVVRLERRIADLALEEIRLRTRLTADEQSLVRLIAIMERLKRRPAALALLQPETAISTARSVGLIRQTVPTINARALELRADLASLARIESDLARERFALSTTRKTLTATQKRLDRQLADKRAAVRQYRQQVRRDSVELARLTEEAADLRALLEAIMRLTPQPKPRRTLPGAPQPKPVTMPELGPSGSFSSNRGKLSYPVAGTQVLRFGQLDGVVKSRGTKLATTAGSSVYAPFDGTIVFAGNFRSYGLVLIIAHDGGYHSLLAGMSQIYGTEGDQVLTGEPVGVVGSGEADVEAQLADTSARPELYIELRRNGDAIDPAPWFRVQTAAR